MKPSILIVMLDFLVCSLLLFVVGDGGPVPRRSHATGVHEAFSASALEAQQQEWDREYERQMLRARLERETTIRQQLEAQLAATTVTLAERESQLRVLTEEQARLHQLQQQTEQTRRAVEEQLARVEAERARLAGEGEAMKAELARVEAEHTRLLQEKTELARRAAQLGETVASQQATITLLSEEIRAAQARMESQLGEVLRGQVVMNDSLAQLETFTRQLPAQLQTALTDFAADQRRMQDDIAALLAAAREVQAALAPDERARLLGAIEDLQRGQQELSERLRGLYGAGGEAALADALGALQAGQVALTEQTARLAERLETVQAQRPGPHRAVRAARLEWRTELRARHRRDGTEVRFRAQTFPPTVQLGERIGMVLPAQTLGVNWRGTGPEYEITEMVHTLRRHGEIIWQGRLAGVTCVFPDEPRLVFVPLPALVSDVQPLRLAEAETVSDQLYVFKSTAAGLSFVAETAVDLADERYRVLKQPLRGMAAWFENPAYRGQLGDALLTADGQFVGILVARDRAFILTPQTILDCPLPVSSAR
ncbi:MAG: hypothetical protein N3A53_00055 [Verrucomicrobiae bacterium]|nr:hypothetical protein [Verrucomicrobiae bacterium]